MLEIVKVEVEGEVGRVGEFDTGERVEWAAVGAGGRGVGEEGGFEEEAEEGLEERGGEGLGGDEGEVGLGGLVFAEEDAEVEEVEKEGGRVEGEVEVEGEDKEAELFGVDFVVDVADGIEWVVAAEDCVEVLLLEVELDFPGFFSLVLTLSVFRSDCLALGSHRNNF
jgi:hypothetical protein